MVNLIEKEAAQARLARHESDELGEGRAGLRGTEADTGAGAAAAGVLPPPPPPKPGV